MTQKYNSQRSTGFTIVELMIAMVFISFLLLAIAMTVMQVGAIHNKGLTMKSVNQAGRVIVDDMKRAVAEGDAEIVYKPHDFNSGSQTTADYDGGRLCTGLYSYIWNIGTHTDANDPSVQFNKYSVPDNAKQLRLVKVRDNGGQYCKDDAAEPIDATNATELLSENNLAVQGFHIERLTTNSGSGMSLYSIGITISNADKDAIATVDNTCKPPHDPNNPSSDDANLQNYCAVNEFIFTAHTGNRGGE